MDTVALYRIFSECHYQLSTDTRTLIPGDVYIALRGETMDGNAYAEDALAKGAAYAVIDDASFIKDGPHADKYILVKNGLQSLQGLAHYHRKQFSIPVIVIGGSNGKTTTKELTVAALGGEYVVHATAVNHNNHIGVPLTLLGLRPEHQLAVIEVGANHPGEHTLLAAIAEPTHLYITNHGKDHLEGFGSIEGVRKANNELLEAAKEYGSLVFVNKNIQDIYQDAQSMHLSISEIDTDYSIEPGLFASLSFAKEDQKSIQTQLVGDYNAPNIAAAVSIARFFNVSFEKIKDSLQAYIPGLMRSQLLEKDGMRIILDCYNANPSSMLLSLQSFFATSDRPKLVIVGDMRELGSYETEEHQAIVNFLETSAANHAPNQVVLVGQYFEKTTGLPQALRFHDSEAAKAWFDPKNYTGYDVFVKASRGTALEKIFNMARRG